MSSSACNACRARLRLVMLASMLANLGSCVGVVRDLIHTKDPFLAIMRNKDSATTSKFLCGDQIELADRVVIRLQETLKHDLR